MVSLIIVNWHFGLIPCTTPAENLQTPYLLNTPLCIKTFCLNVEFGQKVRRRGATYANPFPNLTTENKIMFCARHEKIVNRASIPIDPKITDRLPFMSPQTPQKYAPNTIPEKTYHFIRMCCAYAGAQLLFSYKSIFDVLY